ncbi:putative lipid-transfer protein DIR1 [Phaseolus vulgaris]|uniref:putative lipid-transfer protein DIR1 n=1 Tax=Phaseolus vulgaris TaxID=3885 RepID=UPI0035CB6CAB
MAHTSGNVLVQWLLATLLIAMLGGAKAIVLCDTESSKLSSCYAAVTGQYPPKPNEKCCDVVKHSNLPCLCRYKSILPAFGFNPTNALALPSKCGLKTPPECRGNNLMPE